MDEVVKKEAWAILSFNYVCSTYYLFILVHWGEMTIGQYDFVQFTIWAKNLN